MSSKHCLIVSYFVTATGFSGADGIHPGAVFELQSRHVGKIVKSKDYLVQKNHEQVAATLSALVIAILFWDLVLVFVQKYAVAHGATRRMNAPPMPL